MQLVVILRAEIFLEEKMQCSMHCPHIITTVKLKIAEEKNQFQAQEYFV